MIAYIATSETIEEETRTIYGDLMRTVVPGWHPPNETTKYDSVLKLQDFSPAWAHLNAEELERAQAFRLGKLLWCIFEWSACIKCNLSPDNVREQGSRLGFPNFVETPLALQRLIHQCTARAPEWGGRHRPVAKEGDRLVCTDQRLGAQSKRDGGDSQVLVRKAARDWWQEELRQARVYVEARASRKDQGQRNEKPGLTLVEILESLQKEEDLLGEGSRGFHHPQ